MYVYAKNNENWLAVDKVIAKISRLTFLTRPVFTTGGFNFRDTQPLKFTESPIMPPYIGGVTSKTCGLKEPYSSSSSAKYYSQQSLVQTPQTPTFGSLAPTLQLRAAYVLVPCTSSMRLFAQLERFYLFSNLSHANRLLGLHTAEGYHCTLRTNELHLI